MKLTLVVPGVISELHALKNLHIRLLFHMGCGISHGALDDVELMGQIEILFLFGGQRGLSALILRKGPCKCALEA